MSDLTSTDAQEYGGTAGILVDDLTVRYVADEPNVLESLSLRIRPGEIVALVGASGCGKSTLLRTIARLIKPSSGSIQFTGDMPQRRLGDMSYVFQEPTLLPWRTVVENVRLPLELGPATGLSERTASPESPGQGDRISAILHSVGLDRPVFGRFPRELSGGMKMRVSIARALVTDPNILLLDEPFAALDDMLRTRMNSLVLKLWEQKPRTIVFVTHNIAEAAFLSHRVAVLGGGRVSELLENRLPWPRTTNVRTTTEFAEFYGQVSSSLVRVAS